MVASAPGAAVPPRWILYETRTVFVLADNPAWLRRTAGPAPAEVRFLAISRDTGTAREARDSPEGFQQKLEALRRSAGNGGGSAASKPGEPCDAIIGVISVDQAAYLLAVTQASVAVSLGGERIQQVTRCEAFPFSAEESSPPAAVTAVRQLLEHNFYFSHDVDISRRLQERSSRGRLDPDSAFESAVPAFVWNRCLVEPVRQQEGVSSRWFSPMVQGFFQVRECRGQGTGPPDLFVVLMARRSAVHAGTRYSARGLDDTGVAANWVETEQAAYVPSTGTWLSLTQVRGSAPIFWEQLSGNSPATLTRGADLTSLGFDRHRRLVEDEYGTPLFVSLLSGAASKQATEGIVQSALASQFNRCSGLAQHTMDFHARVSRDSLDSGLEALTREIADTVRQVGFFEARQAQDGSRKPISKQQGVIRTNCFDCLDRTNLFQYQLAWEWLLRYCQAQGGTLKELVQCGSGHHFAPAPRSGGGGFFDAAFGAIADVAGAGVAAGQGGDAETTRPPLQELLRSLWADLGDALSELYTGAPSTWSATLRQGGTSAMSLVEMGWNSVNRAYCAKFEDDAKQDALRLLLGPQKLLRAPRLPEIRRQPCGKLTVAVVTWNVHAEEFWRSPTDVQALLRGACGAAPAPSAPTDVVVVCLQELIELSPTNVMTLSEGDATKVLSLETALLAGFSQAVGETFVKAQSVSMVGLYLGVFVAQRLASHVGGVACDRMRSGLYGQAGNKGAVAVRLQIASTSLCALSLHLESGCAKEAERAGQLEEALTTSFKTRKDVQDLAQHDLVVLAGDFNFRLALPEGGSLTGMDIMAKEWRERTAEDPAGRVGEGVALPGGQRPESQKIFGQYDELCGSAGHRAGSEALQAASLVEGPVLFPPTYRLLKGQAVYDKERMPAWTDRVMHSKVGTVRRRYCALGALRQSDHRPVCALLETNLLAIPGQGPGVETAASGGAVSSSSGRGAAVGAEASSTSAKVYAISPTASAASLPTAGAMPDLLDMDARPAVGGGAVGSSSSARSSIQDGARAALVTELQQGRRVLAEFQGGWYLANVIRMHPDGATCDVAWLRPRGDHWGDQAYMRDYLCSTGADETQHGGGLAISTRIRIPGESQAAFTTTEGNAVFKVGASGGSNERGAAKVDRPVAATASPTPSPPPMDLLG